MAYTLEQLITDPPHIHGFRPSGEEERWGLAGESLRMLDGVLEDGQNTLETGSGVSTVLFALYGTNHICISPVPDEHERIRAFCGEQGISLERTRFVAELSEDALPRLDLPELDVILIDGSHSFPCVFIDWYYATKTLRIGGHVLVDDTSLWTGQVLRDFLESEPAWELVTEVPMRTATFRKIEETGPAWNWLAQPYVVERSALTPASRAIAMLKAGQLGWIAQKVRKRVGLTGSSKPGPARG
jgi:predicted O-methyltransferase YrrM